MMSKIVYLTNVRMPTPKAHGIQMIKMCEAFATLGREVIFAVPGRKNEIKEDPFEYYGVRKIFKIKKLPVFDIIAIAPRLGYWLEYLSFAFVSFFYLALLSRKDKVIYTREYGIVFLARILGFDTAYEAHRILRPKGLFFFFAKGAKSVITNSRGTAEEFAERGFKKVLTCPNGVDLSEFEINPSQKETRKTLGLPVESRVVMYTGNFYNWKGTETLIKAASLLSDESEIIVALVGGNENEVLKKKEECRRAGIPNVVFLGHKNRKDIPRILKAADVLVLPNSPISEESIKYTSPVKLGEYMASGVPIVASDLPSIRAIASEKAAYFVSPDNPTMLKDAILALLHDKPRALELSRQALLEVKKYTWLERAEKILQFINQS